MKKIIKRFSLMFLCAMFILCNNVTSFAQETKQETVRVAYFDLGSYYNVSDSGEVKSYDSAYLNCISEYTDYDFEYIDCKTWDNALVMLENNQVDLVGTMQWTEEREQQYAICDSSYGYTVAELAALKDSGFIYEDYEAINGKTVGCIKNYVIGDQLRDFMKLKNFTVDIKTYDNQTELDKALENKEIDLIAANAHAIHSDWDIVEKFSYAPFYFASRKDNNELVKNISEAIIKINIHQSDYNDKLIKEYFPRMVNSPYTKTEMDVVNQNKEYTIYFDKESRPLVWYDEEKDEMDGVLVSVCNQLSEKTGLKFDIKPKTDDVDLNAENAVSYRTLYYDSGIMTDKEKGVTQSILDQTFQFYHKTGEKYNPSEKYNIAIVKCREGLEKYIEEKYPDCSITTYETPLECISSVDSDYCDLAFIDSHIADDIITNQGIDNISALPITGETFGIALAFNGENKQVLAEICSKGAKLIDTNAVNDIMLEYALSSKSDFSLSYIVRNHFNLFISIVAAVILVIAAFTAILTYARVMKKERNRVEQATKERTEFFARMSHDMRTPMNGILGMIELSEQSDSMDEVKANLLKAKSSGQYMLSLINDTLDLQRLESGKLKFDLKNVRIGDIIMDIVGMSKPSAELKNITLELVDAACDMSGIYRCDPVRVKQIFMNILSNSIKFTTNGGKIVITVDVTGTDNDIIHTKTTIQDTGIGMSESFIQNNLFKSYSQEHNSMTSKYAGSGLGLAITKNLVTLMGGTIEVESELGEGTTFTVYLDMQRVSQADDVDDDSGTAEVNLEGKRILLCEDHPLNAEIAKKLLEKAGCKVVWKSDGKLGFDAVSKSEWYYFDAILMDMQMPVMDGITATQRIRQLNREDVKVIPIIALSANAYKDDIEKCLQNGMTSHLAKPVEPDKLYAALKKALSNV